MKRSYGKASPWISLSVNILYGLYTGVVGILGHSWWFVSLAAYYTVLSVIRFALICWGRNAPAESDGFISRFVGGMFLFLSVTLAGITYLSFRDDRGTQFHEIVMISIALYAFTKITLAIIRMVQSRGRAGTVLRCLRSLSLADAAVSIFALQRSMLVTFDGMSPGNISLMNALTGTAVYLLTAVLGINLIGGKNNNGKIKAR